MFLDWLFLLNKEGDVFSYPLSSHRIMFYMWVILIIAPETMCFLCCFSLPYDYVDWVLPDGINKLISPVLIIIQRFG